MKAESDRTSNRSTAPQKDFLDVLIGNSLRYGLDLGTLFETNWQTAEGLKTLIETRDDILKEAFAEWQAAVRDVAGADTLFKLAEAAKHGVAQIVAQFPADETQARGNAWSVLLERMQQDLSDLEKLLRTR